MQQIENSAMTLEPGQIIGPLVVSDLTLEGGAVARLNGQVVFIDSGLPEEELMAEVVSVKKHIIHAKAKEQLKPSPFQVTPVCPHATDCGGCTWQHLAMKAQHAWKENHLQQTLSRIGKVEVPKVDPIIASPQVTAFRNKMSYAFGRGENEKTIVGLRKKNSHDLVEVTACSVQDPAAMVVLEAVRGFLRHSPIPAFDGKEGVLQFVVVHTPQMQTQEGAQLFIEIITTMPSAANKEEMATVRRLAECLSALDHVKVAGVAHTARKGKALLAQGDTLICSFGAKEYEEQFGHLHVQVPHSVFLQTNTLAAALLYKAVSEAALLTEHDVVWDLYCGIGSAGLYLADRVASVRAFDIQPEAIQTAIANTKRLGIKNCRFRSGNLPALLKKEDSRPTVIIADPPRAGMEQAVLDCISKTDARVLIYVSCDVGTQARDLARLQPFWRPVRSQPVDMFPYTPHMENILVLERLA